MTSRNRIVYTTSTETAAQEARARAYLAWTPAPSNVRSAMHQMARGETAPARRPGWTPPEQTYGKCGLCGCVEVALNKVAGFVDLSDIGESSRYPLGYGCELCS